MRLIRPGVASFGPLLQGRIMPVPAGKIRSYRDLIVWQRGMDLIVLSYKIAKRLPPIEMYGLASQIRRAAVSVPANIAEGHGRHHRGEYVHHLSFANGS